MNERIKELALQASKEAFPTGSMAWMEVFAELIVRDCIDIIEGYCETSPEIYGLPLEVMDHFGIDEIEE